MNREQLAEVVFWISVAVFVGFLLALLWKEFSGAGIHQLPPCAGSVSLKFA